MANPKFEFEVESKILSLECSHFGKETVTLDGHLVAKSKAMAFSSRHKVSIEGAPYTIEIIAKNIITGNLTCNLYKGDELVLSKYTKAELGDKNKIISNVLLLTFCGILGGNIGKMGPWIWLSPLIFVFCVILAFSCRERIYNVHTKNI